MSKRSLLSFFCFLVLTGSWAYAQEVNLKGRVLDSLGHPLEYISVFLSRSDGTQVKSGFSDTLGRFGLRVVPGRYLLKLEVAGYTYYSKEVQLDTYTDLGEIKIERSIQLRGIEVKALKKTIERKVDRLVFNLGNTLVSQGVDLTEVLAITPLLNISENNIGIVGKSGVGVMVNGKLVQLEAEDLMNYLKSIRSENVAAVEVITTPPSKYEAQGNSGLINIILKKNTSLGFSGNVSSSYLQRNYAGTANTVTLNYKTQKIGASVAIRQNFEALRTTENRNFIGINSILMKDIGKTTNNGYGGNIRLAYKINEFSEIGVIYDFNSRDADRDINNRSIYETKGVETDILNTFTQHRQHTNTNTLNGYYDLKLDTTGKNLSFSVNYLSNTPDGKIALLTHSEFVADSYEKAQNISDIKYGIWSGQVDLTLPYKWIAIDGGLKFTKFDNNSDVRYLDLIGSEYITDPSKSDVFEYDEKNYSAYLSSSKKIGGRLTLQAGIRYEHSVIDNYSLTTGSKNASEYGNWFPTAYARYQLNEGNSFSLRYSRRIDRPQFKVLNPFRRYLNPNAYFTGNPLLQPAFSHNVELGYSSGDKFSIDAYWMKIQNGYAPYQYLDNNVLITTYGNYFDQENWGVYLTYSENLTKWWTAFLSASSSYAKPRIREINAISQSGMSLFYTVNNTFTLNQAKTLLFLLSYDQGISNRQTNFYSKSMADLTAGVRYSMLESRLNFNLSVNDIFRQQVSRGQVFFTDNTQYYNNYFDNRKLTFSVSYSFGNKKVKQNARNVKFDEKSRAVN